MGKLFDGIKRENNFNEIHGYREPVSMVVVSNRGNPKKCLMLDEHTMTQRPHLDNQNHIKMQRNQSFKNAEFVPSSTDVSDEADSYDENKRELKLDLRYRDGREDRHKEIMLSPQQLNDLMEMLESFKSDNSSYAPDHHKIDTTFSESSSSLASTIREMKIKAKKVQGSLPKETADRIKNFLSKSDSFNENERSKDCRTTQTTRSKLSSELQNMKSLSNSSNKSGNIFLTDVNSIQSKSELNRGTTHRRFHVNGSFPPSNKTTGSNLASNNRNVEHEFSALEDFDPSTMIDFLYRIERAIEGGHLDPSIFLPLADDFQSPRGRGLSSPELLLTSNTSNSSPNSHPSRYSSPLAMEKCDETKATGDGEIILKNCAKVISPPESRFKIFNKDLKKIDPSPQVKAGCPNETLYKDLKKTEKTDLQVKMDCPNVSQSTENNSEPGIRLMGMYKKRKKPRVLQPKVRKERVVKERASDITSFSDQIMFNKSRIDEILEALDEPNDILDVFYKPKFNLSNDEALQISKKSNNSSKKIKSKNERMAPKLKKFEGLTMPEKYLALQKICAHPTLNCNQSICLSRSSQAPVKADTPGMCVV